MEAEGRRTERRWGGNERGLSEGGGERAGFGGRWRVEDERGGVERRRRGDN